MTTNDPYRPDPDKHEGSGAPPSGSGASSSGSGASSSGSGEPTSQGPDYGAPYGEPVYPYYPQGQHNQQGGQYGQAHDAQYGQAHDSQGHDPYGQGQHPGYGQQYGSDQQYGQGQHGQGQHGQGQHGQLQPYGGYGQQQSGHGPYPYFYGDYQQHQNNPYYQQTQTFGPPSYPYYGYPPTSQPRKKRSGLLVALGALIVVAAVVFAVSSFFINRGSDQQASGNQGQQFLPFAPNSNGGNAGNGSNGGSSGQGSTGASGRTGSQAADATQKIGVVTIVSVLKYEGAESAGTGTIMTSGGRILTNNHVISGATAITVTDETTDKQYRAAVVGTAPTEDVAVLQLADASGLKTAKYASSSSGVQVGDSVVGVGNAGGTGSLTASSGQVTGLNKSITATNDEGSDAERLHDLIQINAPIIAGDSGGPLYNANGDVIGMDTAASATRQSATHTAYAIRVENAMSVVKKIDSGVETTTIHIGLPGFMGVSVQAVSAGAGVAQVYPSTPAARAGIVPGSIITGVNGTSVSSITQLHNELATKNPGAKVSISWTDPQGQSHTKSLTLISGPAD